MLFICYPKCTTCKKAQAYLDEKGTAYEFRDIKLENPSEEELRQWWKTSGLPLKKFFNTSGLQYKALGLKDKLPTMSEEEQLALLATDGLLVKRPLLVGDDFVLTGFRQAEWDEMALQKWGSAKCGMSTSVVRTGILFLSFRPPTITRLLLGISGNWTLPIMEDCRSFLRL